MNNKINLFVKKVKLWFTHFGVLYKGAFLENPAQVLVCDADLVIPAQVFLPPWISLTVYASP